MNLGIFVGRQSAEVQPVQLIDRGNAEGGVLRDPVASLYVPHVDAKAERSSTGQTMNVLVAEPVLGTRLAEPHRVVVPAAHERLAAVEASLDHRPPGAVDPIALTVHARRPKAVRHTGPDDVDAVAGRRAG